MSRLPADPHASNGNGKPPVTRDDVVRVRNERRLVQETRLLREEKIRSRALDNRERRSRKLLESGGDWTDWIGAYSGVIDRFQTANKDFAYPFSTANDRRYGAHWPFWRTWTEHSRLRAQSRLIYTLSPLASGAISALTSYVIGEGMHVKVTGRQQNVPEEIVTEVQFVVDEWVKTVDFSTLQQEYFTRARRDGEAFLREWPQDDGMVLLRILEPECIIEPPGMTLDEASFGIIVDPDDLLDTRAFWWAPDGVHSNGEEIPASAVAFVKENVDGTVKRGLPDFAFNTQEFLQITDRLLRNMGQGAAVRSAIAYIRQHEIAPAAAVADFVEGLASYSETDTFSGDQRSVIQLDAATVLDIDKGQTYTPGPMSENEGANVSVVQALLRAVAVRWNAPEWVVSGDSSNQNMATAMVAESPFVKTCKRFQRKFVNVFERLVENFLKHWCRRRGGIRVGKQKYDWRTLSRLLTITITPPTVETRDRVQESQLNRTYIELGVKSRQTVSQEIGVKWKVEERNNEEYEKKHGEQGVAQKYRDDGSAEAGNVDANPLAAMAGQQQPGQLQQGQQQAQPGQEQPQGADEDTGDLERFLDSLTESETTDKLGRHQCYDDTTGQHVACNTGTPDAAPAKKPYPAPGKAPVFDHTQDVAKKYRLIVRQTLKNLRDGKFGSTDEARGKIEDGFDRASASLRGEYARYQRHLEDRVTARYGADALDSPEWKNVRHAVRDGYRQAVSHADEMAEHLRATVNWMDRNPGKPAPVGSGDAGQVDLLTDALAESAASALDNIADAIGEFKAKFAGQLKESEEGPFYWWTERQTDLTEGYGTDKRGRVLCWDDKTGHRVKCHAGVTNAQTGSRLGDDVATATETLKRLVGNPASTTPEDLKTLTAQLAGLTKQQIKALQKEHGIHAGGAKEHLVKRVTEAAGKVLDLRHQYERLARSAGVPPKYVTDLAREEHGRAVAWVKDGRKLVMMARQYYRQMKDGKVLSRSMSAFRDGKGPSAIPEMELIARGLQGEFPAILNGADETENAAILYDLLAAGGPAMPNREDAYKEALGRAQAEKAKGLDDVPFDVTGEKEFAGEPEFLRQPEETTNPVDTEPIGGKSLGEPVEDSPVPPIASLPDVATKPIPKLTIPPKVTADENSPDSLLNAERTLSGVRNDVLDKRYWIENPDKYQENHPHLTADEVAVKIAKYKKMLPELEASLENEEEFYKSLLRGLEANPAPHEEAILDNLDNAGRAGMTLSDAGKQVGLSGALADRILRGLIKDGAVTKHTAYGVDNEAIYSTDEKPPSAKEIEAHRKKYQGEAAADSEARHQMLMRRREEEREVQRLAAERQATPAEAVPEPEPTPEPTPKPATPALSTDIPDQIRSRLQQAIAPLERHREALATGIEGDRQFQGDGRYEWDAFVNQVKAIKEPETITTFRQLADENGVNADAVLAGMGYRLPELSDKAKAYGRDEISRQDRQGKSVPDGQREATLFTGTDALNRHWVNGKLVAKPEEAATASPTAAAEPTATEIPQTPQERSVGYFNVMQTLSTGRLNADTEAKVVAALGADDLVDAYRKLKTADGSALASVAKLVGPRHGNGAPVDDPQNWELARGTWRKKLVAKPEEVKGGGKGAGEFEPSPAATPAKPVRFETGKALNPDEKKQVLDSVKDVYKENGLEKTEIKGYNHDDDPIYGYPYSPGMFVLSDITGAKVRHYITLPDGRKAHPSELFPNLKQADIDRAMGEQDAAKRNREGRDASREARHSETKGDANDAYKRTNRPMNHSFLAKGPDGRIARVDGTDKEDLQYFDERGYQRVSDPVPADTHTDKRPVTPADLSGYANLAPKADAGTPSTPDVPPAPASPPMTTGNAAKHLKVAPRTVSKWADSGLLASTRDPKTNNHKIRPADLVAFMKHHGMEAPAELASLAGDTPGFLVPTYMDRAGKSRDGWDAESVAKAVREAPEEYRGSVVAYVARERKDLAGAAEGAISDNPTPKPELSVDNQASVSNTSVSGGKTPQAGEKTMNATANENVYNDMVVRDLIKVRGETERHIESEKLAAMGDGLRSQVAQSNLRTLKERLAKINKAYKANAAKEGKIIGQIDDMMLAATKEFLATKDEAERHAGFKLVPPSAVRLEDMKGVKRSDIDKLVDAGVLARRLTGHGTLISRVGIPAGYYEPTKMSTDEPAVTPSPVSEPAKIPTKKVDGWNVPEASPKELLKRSDNVMSASAHAEFKDTVEQWERLNKLRAAYKDLRDSQPTSGETTGEHTIRLSWSDTVELDDVNWDRANDLHNETVGDLRDFEKTKFYPALRDLLKREQGNE